MLIFYHIIVSTNVFFYNILTPYRTQTLLKSLYPVQERYYDICRKGCHLFMTDDLTTCPNNKCNTPRYRESRNESSKKESFATMLYLPVSDQLATFIAHSPTRNLLYNKKTSSGALENMFDGSVIKEKNWSDNDLILVLYVDGFQPFIHSVVSMTIVHIVIMNLPDDIL